MGFWRGTFRALKATKQAYRIAGNLFDEAHHSSIRFKRRSQIQNEISAFERERSRLGESWFVDNQFESKALNNLYEELCRDYSRSSVDDKYFKQKNKFQADYADYKVKVLLTKIKQDNVSIREAASSLAITKIKIRKRLIKRLTELLNIGSPIKHGKYIARAKSRRDELHNEIIELEPQRQTVITSNSLPIASKVEYEIYDDKKNGFYKDWFENGNQRWLIHFEYDELAIAERFDEDGSLYIKVTPEGSSRCYKVCGTNNKVTLKAIKQQLGFTLFVKQCDRVFLKLVFKNNECPSKMAIFLNVIMSFNGLISIVMPSKRPVSFDELQQVIQGINSVSNELRAIENL